MVEAMGAEIKAYTYDGDTPQPARTAIRQAGQVVVTNPDMLHSGILPHHTKWVRLFENLRYVVIDEIHAYRGVFGSNLANVIRRLKRICAFYGSHPQFICCSATIANPRELACALTGEEVTLIDENGAPAGVKHVVFYNPPVVNRQLGIRRSAQDETLAIVDKLLKNDIQTIVFTRSRVVLEVLVRRLKDGRGGQPGEAEGIRGYRGGYLPTSAAPLKRRCGPGRCAAWSPPMPWNWASTSGSWMPACCAATRAPSPGPGSRRAVPGAGTRPPCSSWWAPRGPWTSTS